MSTITVDRTVLEQALEALQRYQVKRQDFDRFADEITALRAALAQPLPDPVDEYRKGFIAGQIDMRDRPEEQEPEPPTQAGALHAMKTALWEQEPVLVVEKEPDYMSRGHFYEGSKTFIDPTLVWKLPIGTKLYTAPPRREWRSLSEEEINETLDNNLEGGTSLFDICRAVEAALKEKNHE